MAARKKCIIAWLFWDGTKRASKFWVINAENAIERQVRSLPNTYFKSLMPTWWCYSLLKKFLLG